MNWLEICHTFTDRKDGRAYTSAVYSDGDRLMVTNGFALLVVNHSLPPGWYGPKKKVKSRGLFPDVDVTLRRHAPLEYRHLFTVRLEDGIRCSRHGYKFGSINGEYYFNRRIVDKLKLLQPTIVSIVPVDFGAMLAEGFGWQCLVATRVRP